MATHTCVTCGTTFTHDKPGRPPVTCSPECHRLRKNRRDQLARIRNEDRGCPEKYHGTSTGYSNYRCSCNLCQRWAREYKDARRKQGIDK